MDTIHIDNLVFSGRHGVLETEQHTPQRFSISVCIDTLTKKASRTDDVQDVIDYQPIKDQIQSIVEGPHVDLIETLAESIADTILSDIRIHGCTVTIKKLDIFDNGLPGITIRRKQKTKHVLHISLTSLFKELEEKEIAVRRLIPRKTQEKIKEAALPYPFKEAEREYGSRNVQQNFSYFREYPKDNMLWEIGHELEFLLSSAEDTLPVQVFEHPLSFTEVSSQCYPVGHLGISIHRDESRFRNIIAVCVIEGAGEFYTQPSRESFSREVIPVSPGDVIFMTARGFAEREMVPLHGVGNITAPRLSVTYRQEET